jgi:hypothetical protein
MWGPQQKGKQPVNMEEDKRRPGATKMKAIRTPPVTQAEALEEESSPHTPQQEVVAGGSTSRLVVEPQDNPSVTKTSDWTQQYSICTILPCAS